MKGQPSTNTNISVTATVERDGKFVTVPVGKIKTLDNSTAYSLPPGASQANVGGLSIPLTGEITQANMTVTTRPTVRGDFFWALGAPRDYEIADIKVNPVK